MIEDLIISHLALNEEYSRKVLPFVDAAYFHSKHHKISFDLISKHIDKYNELPSKSSLLVDLESVDKLSHQDYKEAESFLKTLVLNESELDWLVDTTERFCQDKAIYNALMKSIEIVDDKEGKLS